MQNHVAASTLTTDGVSVTYGGDPIVKNVDVFLMAGGVTALIGPNGSGKTTLLRGLCRLAPYVTGRIELDGVNIDSFSPRAFARQLTVLAQQRPTPHGLTVEEVVGLGRHPHRRRFGTTDAEGAGAIDEALALTELIDLREQAVTELSGGQLQRVWLATCLAQDTKVLLLDEPTTFLDLRHQMSLLDLIRDLADSQNLTIGVVLHDLAQAADIADHVVLLSDGEIVASGTPHEVMTSERLSAVYGVTIEVFGLPDGGLNIRARRAGRSAHL